MAAAPTYVDLKSDLSKLSNGWGKYKEKVSGVSDSNQNVETSCNSKIKFTELKDFSSKGSWKISQTWIMYGTTISHKTNETCNHCSLILCWL